MDIGTFYSTVRASLGSLNQSQVDGFTAVLKATDGQALSHRAYTLATPWWETARTMQPVREANWLDEAWRKAHLRYYPWYGRGYVQLTWEPNYAKADTILSAAAVITPGQLLHNPDLAMRPDVAAFILRHGMDQGWFTGVSLAMVLPLVGVATHAQYSNARTIINGHDKAEEIEAIAQVFERALLHAGYGK